ncbi:PRK06851 family protein [Clostridium sp. UBA871]|uniref:PRK06851 family protein n=1 Tax=Clostridium sp. UBA871 TaxID=1946380 RepID=UPI0032162029
MTGISTHYFLGGNTGKGFYSHFNYIISQKDATRIICLKGGPGTGKSSLMKKIGKHYIDRGYDVEFHHCSSDSDSLDGVLIKELKVAMLDGTSPHMIDPIIPGAVDDIVNMGICLKEENFKNIKFNILAVNKEIGNSFRRAYRFFAAAKSIYDDWYTFNNEALNLYELNILKENLKNRILPNTFSSLGKKRHLFATGFTPKGVITYIHNIVEDMSSVYVLKGSPGTGKTRVLEYIADEATRRGLDVEILHTPLNPEKIEHLLIPELKVALVTSNEITKIEFHGEEYDMDSLLDANYIEKKQDDIDDISSIFYILLQKGLDCIKIAKDLHDELEEFYVPNMDFNKADQIYEEVLNKIQGYEDSL